MNMFKCFKEHPLVRGKTYFSHLSLAFRTGVRLVISGVFFMVHAVFPFIPIPRKYNCHDMVHALIKCAGW
jgi:hypothetical protein